EFGCESEGQRHHPQTFISPNNGYSKYRRLTFTFTPMCYPKGEDLVDCTCGKEKNLVLVKTERTFVMVLLSLFNLSAIDAPVDLGFAVSVIFSSFFGFSQTAKNHLPCSPIPFCRFFSIQSCTAFGTSAYSITRYSLVWYLLPSPSQWPGCSRSA